MDIVEFFELSAGRWSSMRTSHHFAQKQQEGGKTNLEMELLDPGDPAVVQLCTQHQVDPATVLRALRSTWDGIMEFDKVKKPGATVLVAIASDQPRQGQLLKSSAGQTPVKGRYQITDDDQVKLIVESETSYAEERIWFESDNVRLRHSSLKRADGFSLASFCSEIRLLSAPPKAADATANAQA
jgi:hypothetical protein